MMLANQQNDPEVFSDALIENQCLLQLWASMVMGLMSSWIYQLGHYLNGDCNGCAKSGAVLEDGSDLETVSLEHLKQMTFLEATIKETLRTLPPSATATRRLTKSVVLDGVLYEKGWGWWQNRALLMRSLPILPNHLSIPIASYWNGVRTDVRVYSVCGGVHACLGHK